MAVDARITNPYNNPTVDNLADANTGTIEDLPALSLEMDEKAFIQNIELLARDSQAYFDDPKGFDLKNSRNENIRLHLGRVEETGLYQHQKNHFYKENQIFVAEEAIVAYVTSQIASPVVIPAGDEPMHKLFAGDLEKAIKCHGEDVVDLEMIVETSVRNIMNKHVAITYLYYDDTIDDIMVEALDPEDVIVDKNCPRGGNPRFILRSFKRSTEELIGMYPDKEAEILKEFGIQRRTANQMTKEHILRKGWVTTYDKKGKPVEGVVTYVGSLMLEKVKNPNYLYSNRKKNLLKFPKKPFIFGNLVNYGKHLIDNTTPLQQAGPMQYYLMRRGRQISENADKANGLIAISGDSGLTTDDLQNMTGDPNQKIMLKSETQTDIRALIMRIEAQQLPNYVIQDKLDARMQVGNIMGAPTDFTGSDAQDGDPTLGQVMLKKNQATGRQDMFVRAITRMLRDYYQYLVQMMIVWYTDAHNFSYDTGDGEFDHITLKREVINEGIRVKAGKPQNPDRSRLEAMALKLMETKGVSLLDAYKMLGLDNPQQLYDNWVKQTSDPTSLAREALDVVDESAAYVAYADIMAGKDVEEKENPSKEYVLSLRKLMINDEFLKAPRSAQNKFIKYVNKCIDSLQERLALDEASAIGESGEGLRPGAPLPNPNMPQQPGMMPPGAPPAPGMPPQGPMPGPGMPPMPPAMPMGAPTPSSVFSGTPIPTPGQSIAPQGISGLPQM